jgi:2-iminobutanoate/2-iminopropanoate deaminase
MARRTTLELPGVAHQAPIPLGCRVDNLVYSSAVMGMDPTTGEVSDDGAEQVRQVFANIQALAEVAGGSLDDIVFFNVFLQDDALRATVNESWLAMFPDAADRPTRHTTRQDLPGNYLVQIQFVAVVADGEA